MRKLLIAPLVFGLLLFVPRDAGACGPDGNCKCKHGQQDEAPAEGAPDSAPKAKKGGKADKKGEAKKPDEKASLIPALKDALAAKCDCTSAADCTCKKGTCKCPKCGSHRQRTTSLIGNLKGAADPLRIPPSAYNDASAGVFL